jgi:ubiquitin-protein ligase
MNDDSTKDYAHKVFKEIGDALSKYQRKIIKEFNDMKTSPPEEVNRVTLVGDLIYLWEVTFILPEASHYQAGEFTVEIDLSDHFPWKAPLVRFIKYNAHRLILDEGCICECMISWRWLPDIKITDLIKNLIASMKDPSYKTPHEKRE